MAQQQVVQIPHQTFQMQQQQLQQQQQQKQAVFTPSCLQQQQQQLPQQQQQTFYMNGASSVPASSFMFANNTAQMPTPPTPTYNDQPLKEQKNNIIAPISKLLIKLDIMICSTESTAPTILPGSSSKRSDGTRTDRRNEAPRMIQESHQCVLFPKNQLVHRAERKSMVYIVVTQEKTLAEIRQQGIPLFLPNNQPGFFCDESGRMFKQEEDITIKMIQNMTDPPTPLPHLCFIIES